MNKRLKKLTALLLSIVMVFSMVTEAFPAALGAEGDGDSTPSTATENRNFANSDATRRPGLYVDFLGDNRNYQPVATADGDNERDTALVTGGVLSALTAPGLIDQSKVTNGKSDDNPNGTVNQWVGYQQNEVYILGGGSIYDGNTIFWAAVGMDKMNNLELFEETGKKGVYGLELGFYYDSRYIEPYTGGAADDNEGYRAIIEAANLSNYASYKWDGYSIVDARTDLTTHTDPVTQEVTRRKDNDRTPDMPEILGEEFPENLEENPWRLTYVSIERTNVDTNRFADVYDPDPEKDTGTQYLLLIPFRLKAYDSSYSVRTCLRLARSAGLLSIGSGDGDTPYAAWERVTTRNPGRELKLMTNFQGDLNIFSGGRHLEDPYDAGLIISKAGGEGNTAKLTIENDPSPTPVFANENGQQISGLYGGTGMYLEVHVETGYAVTVDVYYNDDKNTKVSFTTTWLNDNDAYFTFVMPEHDVTVEVTFQVTSAAEFRLHLDEKELNAAGNEVTDSGIQGNSTVLTATYTEIDNTVTPPASTTTTTIVDKDSPRNNSLGLPGEMVHYQSQVTADIQVHKDYEAVVSIYNVATGQNIEPARNVSGGPKVFPEDGTVAADYVMILPTGGQISFLRGMPESDVVVHVTYRPATKYNVQLSVYHDPEKIYNANNVAQLWTTAYDLANQPRDAYSGVVYHDNKGTPEDSTDDNHSAVKSPFRVIDLVDASSAAGSGSLGGDGRTPTPWLDTSTANNIMAAVYTAYTGSADAAGFQAALAGKLAPLDLRGVTVVAGTTPAADGTGLRKNAKGEFYTDSDLAPISGGVQPFYEALYQLLQDVDAAGMYRKDMPDPADATGATVLYSYFDLTPAQVQAYLLDYVAYEQYVEDKAQYDLDKAKYDLDKAAYDQYLADKKAAEDAGQDYEGPTVREPKLPTAPAVVAPPALQDATAAGTQVGSAAGNWYKPSADTTPATRPSDTELANGQGHTLQVRGGRKMAVVLEAESTYTVASGIRIIDRSGVGRADIVLDLNDPNCPITRSPDYQNVYLFDMPAYDCEVRVIYTERKARELTLKIVGNYFDGTTTVVPGNKATVNGYGPNPGSITAVAITPLTKNGEKDNVLEDSKVTVQVRKDAGYTVSATVEYLDENGQTIRVATSLSSMNDLTDNTTFTFDMPAGATTITITYTDDRPLMQAHLIFTYENNANHGNSGVWRSNHLADTSAREGDALPADITVLPGHYIYAVEAYTENGSFPVTISGNGWNNGQGGNVVLETVMPDAEYWVHVIFMPGPPDPEPGQILRLRLNDPDNTGATPVDNWVKITTPVTLGALGLGATGGGKLTDSDYVTAGTPVRLELHVDKDYFLELLEVQPTGLGAVVVCTEREVDPVTGKVTLIAEFVMPADSATAVVSLRRRTATVVPASLYLHLAKTENGGTPTNVNTVPSFTSPTIRTAISGTGQYTVPDLPATVPSGGNISGAARPGETVEVNINIAPGWYIHSLTVSGEEGRQDYQLYQSYDRNNTAAAVKYDLTAHYSATSVTRAVATFIMPDTDAYVTVNYRKAVTEPPEKDESELEVELVVVDPENLGTGDPLVYADNHASAVVSGVDPARTIAPVGKAQSAMRRVTSARAGEEVVIDYSAAAGYALEIILVTPSGLKVPVNYLGGNKARFTMPNGNVTAIVRFKAEPAIQYTANLVLHFPNGTVSTRYDAIGEGSFLTATNGLHYPGGSPNKLYSMMAKPGDRLDFDMLAHDGYYISNVTVAPDALGVPVEYTGSFGYQSGYTIMPAANIQINVYFEAGWPDDVKPDPTTVNYDLTLEVYDASGSGSTANFESIAGTALTSPDSDRVGSGESRTILQKTYDEDRVVVRLDPAPGCYAKTITVTDSRGKDVPWQYVPVGNGGGIAFEMVPAHVTVTVKYAKLPDESDPEYKSLEVRLHLGSTDGTHVTYGDVSTMGSAELTGPGWPTDPTHQTTVNNGSFRVTAPPQGKALTLVVTPRLGYHVAAAYAVKRGTGELLPLVTASGVVTSMTQTSGSGTATFAMPEDDADVYVIFADNSNPLTPGPDITRADLTATLTVAGPTGSGSGVMQGVIGADSASPVTVTTRRVDATGSDSLYAPQGTGLTVDLTVNDGYGIAAIRVTDGYGNRTPYEWVEGKEGEQFVLTMPATGGARVYVELEKVTPRPTDPDDPGPEDSRLTAQIVVNNGGNANNKATLRYGPEASPILTGALLTPVYAGDRIWVDMKVAPGYQIEYVKVVPAKYGIAPTLYDLPVYDQSTSFLMPGEDVVVYVKFSQDHRNRNDVTLKAEGERGGTGENRATVTTAYSGTRGPVHPEPNTPPDTSTAVAQAAPATATLPAEWVTVDYTWEDGYYITSITVTEATTDAAGNPLPVPFTQNQHDNAKRKGQITFPMVDSNVTVTITWGTTMTKYPAVLHVIDLDNPGASDQSWGQLTWLTTLTGETTQTGRVTPTPYPEGTETLMVPAGETVQVDADAQNGTYIQAAFVIYRADGQMILFNFKDPIGATSSGHKTDTFVMHPCRPDTQVDVYIYYTRERPRETDHSAVLMLDSPAADTTSTAAITRTRVPGPEDHLGKASDSVTANDPAKTHGYVNATDGDTITVTVTPASGFAIDYILMTPLGIENPPGTLIVPKREADGSYAFTMPNENVAVLVKLKTDDSKTYEATLHYKLVEIQEDGSYVITDLDPTKNDWAQLSFTWSGLTTTWNRDNTSQVVPEGATVTLGASITKPADAEADYVLAAYVLEENGDMVPLDKALEGLTETHTPPDSSKLDDTANFTMPGANVHAYVWFVKEKPADNWRTAVLTVFDSDPSDATKDNSGLNSATLTSARLTADGKSPIEVWSTGVTGRADMPEKLAHQFIWVTEGETVTVKTGKIEDGYSFVDATITHSLTSATQTLNVVNNTTLPYEFNYTVGNYNSAVVVDYVKSELTRNPLNVVLIDGDNPGNGTVTNVAEVSLSGAEKLSVASVTSAGARQRIPNVLSGTSITYQIKPASGYTMVVRLKDSTGAVIQTWAVGHDNDKFNMPNGEATLEITYFRGRAVTLSVVDTRGASAPAVSTAQMTEDAFGLDPITADSAGTIGVFTGLPAGTKLTASMTALAADTRVIGALLMDATGTRWLAEDPAKAGDYIYSLANRDVEIRMVVGPIKDPDDPDQWDYLATVSAVNLPTGTVAPTIAVTTPGPNPAHGPDWTVAVPDNTVTATVKVPYGYKAVIHSNPVTDLNGSTPPIEINGPTNIGDADTIGTAQFTMPANNVHVTVTYVKTRFTATIRTAGSGTGAADLTYDTTTVNAGGTPDTIYGLLGLSTETLAYTATPADGSTLTRVLLTTAGGMAQLLTYTDGGSGIFTGSTGMLADDVTITVFFDKDDPDDPQPKHHIAYVTVVDPDNDPDNAAQDIRNTTQNLGGGFLWAYGDETDGMKVMFTVAPGYSAVVTAERADGTSVSVTQQGGNNLTGTAVMNATATLTMPDADVKVTITYSKNEPTEYKLKLRLVGHGQELENQARLYANGFGSTPNLELRGAMAPDLNDLWSATALNVPAGAPLDLDGGRKSNYRIVRATIGLLNASGTGIIPGTEVELALNHYDTTATSLHYMPSADAVVTVYYRLPYEATLLVVDTGCQYYDGGTAGNTAIGHDRTPTVTMSVDRTDLTAAENNPTTWTYTPIKDLNGSETVTTKVDLTTMPTPDRYGKNAEIASVIATTTAGTIHLAKDAVNSTVTEEVYQYPMTTPTRVADDVDITVILRDKDVENKMYTATVYKVGHDNKPGNTASIENSHTPTPPYGDIWTGAYEKDEPVVKVTTEPGYYAIVTAVRTGETTPVAVLQWVTTGTAANPIEAVFKMPAHDVDVTVEYVTEKPKADMTLTLKDHAGEKDNKGDLYNNPTGTPDWVTPSAGTTKLLWAKGDDAPLVSISPTPPTGPATEPQNPYSVTTTAATRTSVGDYLGLDPDHKTGYYIKSITFEAAGFTFDMLGDPTFVPRVPLSGGEIIIEFASGKQSGRPYDPEHAERYNGENVWTWTDPDDSTNTRSGDYITGDKADSNPNPDLSVAPLAGQQGWILAEDPDPEELTVVVTVPTLYDKNEDKIGEDGTDDRGMAALYHAGAETPVPDGGTPDPAKPPIYKFYWWDADNSRYEELAQSTDGGLTGDILVTNEKSLAYAANLKGDFPKGTDGTVLARHYGYQLTLKALGDPDTNPLAKYIQEGGEIYVTATRPDNVPKTNPNDPDIPWVESEKTQVIIAAPDYTATLHIVDVSSSLKNEVEMSVKDDTSYTPVTTDGGKIEKLHGKETLLTKVTRGDPDVKVVSVLAIPKTGSPEYLSPDVINTSTYPFPMVRDDVDIVVTLANGEDALYTATVVKVDPTDEAGNTVAISNQTHPVLNRDTGDPMRWTLGYTGDEIRVDVNAMPGYRVRVRAETVDGTPLAVTPDAGGGTMVVTLDGKMPAANVQITVTFEKVEQDDQSWVTLRVRMDSVNGPLPIDPANKAEGSVGGTVTLTADTTNNYTDTELLTATAVDVQATLATGYAVRGWYVDGVFQTGLTGTNVTIPIPAPIGITNTVITVVLEESKVEDRTPRPFDPAHSVNYTDAGDHINHDDYHGPGHTDPDGHQDGYLMAANKGGSLVEITVPNLYDGDLYTAENVAYTLYAKIGGVMVKLIEGTDYDTVIPVAAVNRTHTATGTDEWTGQVFTIQSLNPTGVLGDYVKNGGIIYITAKRYGEAKPGVPWTESAYTEVVIPADPNRETGYQATLKVIDDTKGATTNHVEMQNANNSTDPAAKVPWHTGNPEYPDEAGHIDKLLGGEIIRTEVAPDAGVIYTVMAHTDSMGDVLLFADPSDTDRYRKDMPTEDMDIIVHFRAEDSHIHIAAVQKRGATAVPGNEADIENTTDGTLNSGTIWTEGRCAVTSTDPMGKGDEIQVEVFTAEGFYATVTMSYYDPTDGHLEEKTLVVLGSSGFDPVSGDPVPLRVTFNMPDADVQVVVFFEAGNRSPRPYDPKHSELYYVDQYKHNTAEDVSTTHQDGWLLAENLGGGSALVTVPTLWSEKDGLEDATNAAFHFYLREKDDAGNYTNTYIPLVEGVDYTLAHYNPEYTGTDVFTVEKEDYRHIPGDTTTEKEFDGVKFRLLEVKTLDDNGDPVSKLYGLLDSGLSLFVSATKLEDVIPPWVEGEMTELVIPSTGLRPFDPENKNPEGITDPTYDDYWITSENRGDYLLVTVPLLNSPNRDKPTEVDGDHHRFQLYLQVDGEAWKKDISGIVNVTSLLKITNIKGYDNFWNVNMEYDPKWTGDVAPTYLYEGTYENGIYNNTYLKDEWDANEGEWKKWHGARFAVEIKSDDELELLFTDPGDLAAAKTNAAILREIFDNDGTMGTKGYRMYITSDEVVDGTEKLPDFRAMDYVDFEVPRYYSLTGEIQSWAPTHIAELRLYREDASVPGGYETRPWLMLRSGLCETMSSTVSSTGEFDPAIYNGHWSMNFVFKSSKLADQTYKLLVTKTAHITYTHTAIELDAGKATALGLYDSTDLAFFFASPIALFAGDIAPTLPGPDQKINDRDRNLLAGFNYGTYAWNFGEDDTAPGWKDSTFNPSSYAYAADLNGDGIISERDMNILMSEFNWLRKEKDYGAPEGLDFGGTGIALLLLEEEVPIEEEEPIEETEAAPEEGEAVEDAVETEEIPPEEETPPEEEAPPEAEEPEEGEEPQEPEEPEEGGEPEDPESPALPDPEDGEDPPDGQTPEKPEPPAEPEPEEPEGEEPTEPEEPSEPPIEPVAPEEETTEGETLPEPEAPEGPTGPEEPSESTEELPPEGEEQ